MFRPLLAALLVLSSACATKAQTSYCESLCDWTVTCAGEERTVDSASMLSDCLAATHAVDDSCEAAEGDGINAASAKLLTECTDAVAAQDCGAVTGSIDELATGAPPAECASQGTDAASTFDAAVDAATETNDQLCDRYAETLCGKLDECVTEQLGSVSDEVQTAMGGTVTEVCLERVSDQVASCKSNSFYAPEEDRTDANAARQSARECLSGFDSVTCASMLSGDISATCVAAMEDPTAYTGAITGVASDFADASE